VYLNINSHRSIPPLGRIRVAAPCEAEWKWMHGNDRVRFCGRCDLNVFNLSAMTTEEAEDLIRRTDGRLYVRFYRRSDATILTKNCRVGLRAIRDKLTSTRTQIIAAILSLLGYLGLIGLYEFIDHELDRPIHSAMNYERSGSKGASWLENPGRGVVMGALRPISFRGLGRPVRSERFIRCRAIFKVIPIYHSMGFYEPHEDVIVRVLMEQDGTVGQAGCLAGRSPLKELAEEAARRWRFEPILVNGEPIEVESVLTFHFKR